MSGISGGMLLVPLAIFAFRAIGRAASSAANNSNTAAVNYEQQQRQRREEIRRSGMNESIGSFRNNMSANINEQTRLNVRASEEMMRELERTQRNMVSLSAKTEPEEFNQYMEQVRTSRQNLSDRAFQIQEGFVRNYHVKITESMNEITRTINGQYAENLSELQKLNTNIQVKQEKAKQFANDYIEEAKALLLSLEQDYEGAKYSDSHMATLQEELNAAIGQFNKGNYEAALATAKDVSLSAIEEIYNCDCKRQEWENYYKLALTVSAELDAYMEEMSVITAEMKQQIEEESGKELEDDIVGTQLSEYSGQTKDGECRFEVLKNKIKELKTFLESEEAKNMSVRQLKDYIESMNTKLYPAATRTIIGAVMNMNNAFSRQNISEEIIDFFEEHNFTFKGYSYDEDKHDGALHIGLENEATGEEIIVTLAPELVEGGDVQTRVEIDQLMGDEANEERKAFYRESIQNVVAGNIPGAQIKLECNKEYKNKLSDKTELRNRLK